MDTILTIAEYFLRITPGVVLLILTFIIARPGPLARIVLYILAFILMRDAMTPLKLWTFGKEGFFWVRLSDDPWFLILFGASSALLMMGFYLADRENRDKVSFFRGNRAAGIVIGILGALAAAGPLLIIYTQVDIGIRGGVVPLSLLPFLLVFALAGNFFEEGLFRGYLLGHLETYLPGWRAAVASGVIFSLCHVFLALTVTNVGAPLLVFTLWEGIICGLVALRFGVIPSTLSHGGAVFLLASGLV
jgi:hypothetical protein